MKALVTGGAGFLGSHIVKRLLRRGDQVVVYDHRLRGKCLLDAELKHVVAVEDDVYNADSLRRAVDGCEAIFHCAAMVGMRAYSGQPAKTMETEEVGLRNVCQAALSCSGTPVIYASSSSVYGAAGGGVGLDEAQVVVPVSSYGTAKRFNEVYLEAEHAEHGLHSAAMRIFNMYGPRQDDRLVIPRFIQSAILGQDLVIYGDGAQTRDFVFVDDVVEAMLTIAERIESFQVINVCSGQETAIRDLAALIIRLTGSRSTVSFRDQPTERLTFEQSRCFGSRTKMEKMTAAKSATSLEDGLRVTVASMVAAQGAQNSSR
jgi:UDP-glucose 4-epimerase